MYSNVGSIIIKNNLGLSVLNKEIGSFLLLLTLVGCGGMSEEERADYNCNDKIVQYGMAKDFVNRHLISPSTAKYPLSNVSGVTISSLGDCTHTVRGYVDAQNLLGVSTRMRYSVTLQNKLGTDSWTLIEIEVN